MSVSMNTFICTWYNREYILWSTLKYLQIKQLLLNFLTLPLTLSLPLTPLPHHTLPSPSSPGTALRTGTRLSLPSISFPYKFPPRLTYRCYRKEEQTGVLVEGASLHKGPSLSLQKKKMTIERVWELHLVRNVQSGKVLVRYSLANGILNSGMVMFCVHTYMYVHTHIHVHTTQHNTIYSYYSSAYLQNWPPESLSLGVWSNKGGTGCVLGRRSV